MEAADTLCSPYWDWARNNVEVPPDEVILLEELDIITASGPQKVPNPLYAYTFHPIHPSFEGVFACDVTTVRWPAPNSNPPPARITQVDVLKEYVVSLYYQLTLWKG